MAVLALLISLLAAGFSHGAVASCPATSANITLASNGGKSGKFSEVHEVKAGEAVAVTAHGGMSTGGVKLKPAGCCNGICAPSFIASASNAIALRGDADIRASESRDSWRAAMAHGLERPPRPGPILAQPI